MSHGNTDEGRHPNSVSEQGLCVCEQVLSSFSTNFWWILFFLFEWIHPSIDQQYSKQTLSTWHQRPCTWTRQAPWIWVVRCFCRSHLQQMFLSKLLEESNSLHSWFQPGHVLFVQSLVCRWNNFLTECMTMCQCGVPLSKYNSLAHTHDWLPHTIGCDEGLPKERIINKRRTQTVLDNRLTPTFFELSLSRTFVNIVCPLSRYSRFASVLSSTHRSTTLSVCPPTDIRLRFFDVSATTNKDLLSHCIFPRIVTCTDKKRVLFGPLDVDCDSTHATTTLSLPVVVFEIHSG